MAQVFRRVAAGARARAYRPTGAARDANAGGASSAALRVLRKQSCWTPNQNIESASGERDKTGPFATTESRGRLGFGRECRSSICGDTELLSMERLDVPRL